MWNAIFGKEHVFSSAQADTFSPKRPRLNRVTRNVGVRTHANFAERFRPAHQLLQVRVIRRWFERVQLSFNNASAGTVERNPISFFEDLPLDSHLSGALIDLNVAGARYATLPHAARDHGSVTGHATARR